MSSSPTRDERGRLLPGVSGNPNGRTKGFRGVSKMIAEKTKNGQDLVDFAIRTWQDETRLWADRWAAFTWLGNYHFGRPATEIEIRALVEKHETHTVNLTGLPQDQLELFMRIREHLDEAAREDENIVDAELLPALPSSSEG